MIRPALAILAAVAALALVGAQSALAHGHNSGRARLPGRRAFSARHHNSEQPGAQLRIAEHSYLFTRVAGLTVVAQGELKIGGVAVWCDTKASADGRNGMGAGGSNVFLISGAAPEEDGFPGCVG